MFFIKNVRAHFLYAILQSKNNCTIYLYNINIKKQPNKVYVLLTFKIFPWIKLTNIMKAD